MSTSSKDGTACSPSFGTNVYGIGGYSCGANGNERTS
jgi:hypothetical protein